jgi:hypothetical protein
MSGTAQRSNFHMKILEGRNENREALPVPVYLASLESPLAREQTVTENVSPHGARVVTSRRWLRGEQPLLTPLTGEFPKYARITYCEARPKGGFCVGIGFAGPAFRWAEEPRMQRPQGISSGTMGH